jgi:hypothetical protein
MVRAPRPAITEMNALWAALVPQLPHLTAGLKSREYLDRCVELPVLVLAGNDHSHTHATGCITQRWIGAQREAARPKNSNKRGSAKKGAAAQAPETTRVTRSAAKAQREEHGQQAELVHLHKKKRTNTASSWATTTGSDTKDMGKDDKKKKKKKKKAKREE